MKSTFNDDFYLVTATVIPLLYLALILQAPMIGRMLSAMGDAIDRMKDRRPKSVIVAFLIWGMYYAWMLAGIAGFAILGIGVSSEVFGILALFHQSDTYTHRKFVLFSTVVLLLITLITPAWTLARDWKNSFYRFLSWF